jgi:CubicO group peptidase (beta-lactamase class C family)
MLARLLCLAPLTLFCTCATAAPTDPIARIEQNLPPAQTLQGAPAQTRTLAAEMARLHVPGVSIAVIRDGKIAWARGYGVASINGAAVTPETLFQAASLSKSVTGVAAMRMVQDGVLALDTPAQRYLASWTLPGGSAVTLRQLLSHTAGTNVGGFPGYAPGTPVPTLLQVLDGVKPAVTDPIRVNTPPGSAWQYSGGGFTVLQQLMIDADRQPFDRLMAARVLQPLGMRHSSFTQPATAAMLAHAALPHNGAGQPYPAGPATYPELAAAGLWTTPSDLARFLIGVQRAAAGQPGQVLTQQSAATLLTPIMKGYALGVGIEGSGAATSFAHGGHNRGYSNLMVAYSGRGDGAVVMTNGDNGDEIARALVRAVAQTYNWPSYLPVERSHVTLPPAQARALAGKYAIKDLGDFDITYDKGELLFWLKAGQSEALFTQSPTSLFVQSQALNLSFDASFDSGRLVMDPFDLRFERVRAKKKADHPGKE